MRISVFGGLAASMFVASPVWAQTSITPAPTSGHPTVTVTVTGSGFGDSEAVDVYFDTTDEELLVSSPTGTLKGPLAIPASAQPGAHYITAIGRRTGDAAQATFSVTTPWVEHGYGAAGLDWNPFENTINTGNAGTLGTLWDVATTALGATPAVAGGRVIVSTEAGVLALSTTSGAVLWSAETNQGFFASPAVVNNVVYVGSSGSQDFYALSATTGAQLWDTPVGGLFYASATVVNGVVYVGCYDNKVYALQASTGAVLWTYATGAGIASSPAVVDGVVYIASYDHKLYALNASTGALLWSFTTGSLVTSSPAVRDGVVYFGSADSYVYAVSAKGINPGSLLWRYQTGAAVEGAPAVANRTVFIGSDDGNMYALNALTGAVLWQTGANAGINKAAVANGVVYFISDNGIFYAVDASDGNILATGDVGDTDYGGPVVSDGVVYISQYGGDTFALTLGGGTGPARVPPSRPVPAALHPDMRLRVAR